MGINIHGIIGWIGKNPLLQFVRILNLLSPTGCSLGKYHNVEPS